MKTNLQQLAADLCLTNLQVEGLHGIGDGIKTGADSYFSYRNTLSAVEDTYLRAWLRNEGIHIYIEEVAS